MRSINHKYVSIYQVISLITNCLQRNKLLAKNSIFTKLYTKENFCFLVKTCTSQDSNIFQFIQ